MSFINICMIKAFKHGLDHRNSSRNKTLFVKVKFTLNPNMRGRGPTAKAHVPNCGTASRGNTAGRSAVPRQPDAVL